jgi:DNA repair protein RecO (recombination protein O)
MSDTEQAIPMSGQEKGIQDSQPAFVLHSYPFRETSLVVEIFAQNFGRLALVARGARRPKSTLRGVLLAFQPLLLSWSGKSELRTLRRAEWQVMPPRLVGMALLCGFYLNELLLKLLPRDDPHERLFNYYQETLLALGAQKNLAMVLRRFEIRLLKELGYALTLERETETGAAVKPDHHYRYVIEHGPVLADGAQDGFRFLGKTLLDMALDDYSDPLTLQQSKALMRLLINHYLGNQTLHTRQLLKDLQHF